MSNILAFQKRVSGCHGLVLRFHGHRTAEPRNHRTNRRSPNPIRTSTSLYWSICKAQKGGLAAYAWQNPHFCPTSRRHIVQRHTVFICLSTKEYLMLTRMLAHQRSRSLLTTLVLALALALISSCGSSAPAGSSGGGGAATSAPAAGGGAAEKKSISIWHIQSTGDGPQLIQQAVDRFKADNPNVD